jgi:hypothetical protein
MMRDWTTLHFISIFREEAETADSSKKLLELLTFKCHTSEHSISSFNIYMG